MPTHALLLTLLVALKSPALSSARAFNSFEDPFYYFRARNAEDIDPDDFDYKESFDAMAELIELGKQGDIERYELWVRDWLRRFDEGYRILRHKAALASWDYNTNITEENAQRIADLGVERIQWLHKWRHQARHIDTSLITDPFMRRQLSFIGRSTRHDDPELTREILGIHNKMQEIYNTGEVCISNGTCYSGEPDLQRFMQNNLDYDKLLWAWRSWRDVVGPRLRPLYVRFVELMQKEANASGYPDMGALWRHELEEKEYNLEEQVENLFEEVKPLYMQLHAYVRYHLVQMYGNDLVKERGPIPAHLLGNMWAQQWDSIYKYVMPYPEFAIPDITTEMNRQGYTPKKMFQLAENFYTSIGLEPMTKEFWERSVLEKPKDGRPMACHGSATNFFDGHDYRIRMCTEVTEQELCTVHHEMGHVEYFMAYRHLPVVFQDGANSAFHEAIGETVQYSVLTPEHLHHIHLLHSLPTSYKTDINFLLKQAMLKLPLLPFSLLMDRWRWDVFSGKIPPDRYNEAWWKLRRKYQGVEAPVPRTEQDFDPGAKYHIPDNTPYIRYYMSSFMQVQFHESLCLIKHGGSLMEKVHRCDIYNSKRAGKKFREMLSLGSSRPWQDALETLTGQRHVSAKPVLRYYAPLYDWLLLENSRLGVPIGWEDEDVKVSRNRQYYGDYEYYQYK